MTGLLAAVSVFSLASASVGFANAEGLGEFPELAAQSAGSVEDPLVRSQPTAVTVSGKVVGEAASVVSGGIGSGDAFRQLSTLDVELDLGSAVGLNGGTLFVQFLSVSADKSAVDPGDIQAYSNIDNDRTLSVIYEAWLEQRLLDGRARLKVGKVDANSEFAAVDAASDFANSSAGFSPTIVGFPTYPDPGMSLSVFVEAIAERQFTLTLGYGVFDGAAGVDGVGIGSRGPATFFSDDRSDDYFHVAEAELGWKAIGPLAAGRLAVGSWRHTGDFETVSGRITDGSDGYYVLGEQRLYGRTAPEGGKGLNLFFQYGRAEMAVSEVQTHAALGVVARGWVPGRSTDSAGLYVTRAGLSDRLRGEPGGDETALDLYYRAEFSHGLFFQPEVHYIDHPSGDRDLQGALVVSARAGFSF